MKKLFQAICNLNLIIILAIQLPCQLYFHKQSRLQNQVPYLCYCDNDTENKKCIRNELQSKADNIFDTIHKKSLNIVKNQRRKSKGRERREEKGEERGERKGKLGKGRGDERGGREGIGEVSDAIAF